MTATPPTGAEVRVQLNNEGTTELARYLGPRVISLDGKLDSLSSDGAMVITVAIVQIADGTSQQWTGEGSVTFPRPYVTSVQLRTLDRRKSTIFGIALVVSLVVIGELAAKGGSNSAPPGSGPGTGIFSIHKTAGAAQP
jgi:hypothetical protein